ncbi:MAG: amino acid adenylation domain-containing protein [Spirochaetales bacterium]|nr:amino acid adenylation domain-containing protein [Spirochaetales bacterium]
MSNITDIYELSPMQKGMLFHTVFSPESDIYIEQFSCNLTGSIDTGIFEKAWELLMKRHAVFCSSFHWEEIEKPVQVVHDDVKLRINTLDYSAFDQETQLRMLGEYKDNDRKKGFALNKAPLMRITNIRLSGNSYYFIWSFHHIIMDGWSLSLVFKELFTIYKLLKENSPVHLPTIKSYRDYLLWLQNQNMQKAEEFWKTAFGDFSSPVSFAPGKENDILNQTFTHFKEFNITFTSSIMAIVDKYIRAQRLTLNSLIQGIIALLLSIYSGKKDICYGTTVSGRPAEVPGANEMIGLFINTLPLRIKVDFNEELSQWLQNLQNSQVEQRKYDYTPLVNIHEWSNVRGRGLFETLFVFENYPVFNFRNDTSLDFEISAIDFYERTNYPLTIFFIPGEKHSMRIIYDSLFFQQDFIHKVFDHFQVLLTFLEQMDLHGRIKDLPLITKKEMDILYAWNQTNKDFSSKECLHQLIEKQVIQTPGRTALVYKDTELSYRQLNTKSNQLAHYLQEMGIKPGKNVGIFLERSENLLICLLAVLKSGGCYVPLDPVYPDDRIRYMIEDAGIKVLITESLLSGKTPESIPTIYIDKEKDIFSKEETKSNPESSVHSGDSAYIIYTSGSTGKPKGVRITHRNLVNFLESMATTPGINSEDVLLSVTTICFDISGLELYLPLIRGAKVVIAGSDETMDGTLLAREIERVDATIMQATPATWKLLKESGWAGKKNIKILCGGEALLSNLAHYLIDNSKSVWNMYGPTETTIWSSIYQMSKDAHSVISIGKPIQNTVFFVLNEDKIPVPIGIPGELYIGGEGVSPGYWQRPELTREKFINIPYFSDTLYRTGDLVRFLSDGNIEFLGRIDNQVKIRGYRIELGEIESVIVKNKGVKEGVVIVTNDGKGEKRLAAYVVLNEDGDINSLKTELHRELPEYMVPSIFMCLDQLPLTPNNKIDRKRLPAIDKIILDQKIIHPRTEVEESLASIFKDVLNIDRIGITQNFFDSGGHSLSATQVITRINKTYSIKLPIRIIFEAPTIEGLSRQIEHRLRSGEHNDIPVMKPVSQKDRIPLSYSQQRLWFLYQFDKDDVSYNISTALKIKGTLDITSLKKAVNTIISRHEILRTSFYFENGESYQKIHDSLKNPIRYIDLESREMSEREKELEKIGLAEAQFTFDLENGLLFRFCVVSLGKEEYIAFLTMHHIITDMWSLGVFMRELTALYRIYHEETGSSLPPLPIQYADFSFWQREWLKGDYLDDHINYWKQVLGNLSVFELPSDYSRPVVQTTGGKRYSFSLNIELVRELRKLSRNEDVTLFMLLYTAFSFLLSIYSSQKDVIIGSPIANRNHSGIENLLGMFVNTLVLRLNLEGDPSFHDLLQKAKEVTLGAYAHQDTPFEYLVDILSPTRDVSRNPIFQIMFVLQNVPLEITKLPGLEMTPLEYDTGVSKFDLSLILSENDSGINGVVTYRTDLFKEETINRFASHYIAVLEQAIVKPDQKLSTFDLIGEGERNLLLHSFNNTKTDYPRGKTLVTIFEERCKQIPHNIALVSEDEKVTYDELNKRVNKLARHIREIGIARDHIVGVYLDRSVEMIIGILSILKAGGAYMPISIGYPNERINYMIENSQCNVILTKAKLGDMLSDYDINIVIIDDINMDSYSDINLEKTPAPHDLAYVLYTSGSTGKPKGVMVEHYSVINHLNWMQQKYQLNETDILIQKTPFTFDVSVWELFLWFLIGSRLVLLENDGEKNPETLIQAIHRNNVTYIHFVPSMFSIFLDYIEQRKREEEIISLKRIFLGGEILAPELLKKFNALIAAKNNTKLSNFYGPTEATVDTTYFDCDGEIPYKSVPIGKPINNVKLYILDDEKHLQPLGIPGELYIGGECLARGYVNRPDLTRERFVTNPFDTSERMYRTGDLAKWLPDGNIEFLGRIDNQVKIRGFRIELGEIEGVIREYPSIKDVKVIVRVINNDSRLLAYYISIEDFEESSLIDFIKERLPDYMIPMGFKKIESFPLNPNGKLNTGALPDIENVMNRSRLEYRAPVSETEKTIAEMWEEILSVEKIGILDNFFDIGGHSLLAMRLVAKIQAEFGVEVSLQDFFKEPFIKTLAEQIEILLISKVNVKPVTIQGEFEDGEI